MGKTIDITPFPDVGKLLSDVSSRLKKGERLEGKLELGKHPLSKTELIGTAIHAGFDWLGEKEAHGVLTFRLKKIGKPGALSEITQARRLIFRQIRIGKGGKDIQIFKLRTMYPMAHKAQSYLYRRHQTGIYGKLTNDFRITPVGKFLRTYWIDELLQLVNILKGEMKLVGLRPLSEGFFRTLPKPLQRERIKHLPGLMAAIYADRPKDLPERVQAEFKYLTQKEKHPILTDVIYFFKVLGAILFRGQRGH